MFKASGDLLFMILTHVTLKQGQGHQTGYDLVDCNQGYNLAVFEQCLLPVKKMSVLKFLSNKETCQLSTLNMCDSQK